MIGKNSSKLSHWSKYLNHQFTVSSMHSTRLFNCNTFLGKDRGCNMFCKSESTCKCFQVHTSERLLLLWEFTAPSHVQREAGRGCFSTACEPGTADWLGSNCSQVRSAGGIYLSRVHSDRGRCTQWGGHPWELTEAYWTWFTTETSPATGLQIKSLAERKSVILRAHVSH